MLIDFAWDGGSDGTKQWKRCQRSGKLNGVQDEWLRREDSERKVGEWRIPSKREASREELLGSWLGEEREAAVFADLRPMKADMGAMVNDVLADVGQLEMLLLTKLQDGWKEIVGEDNAKMCRPLSLVNGCLRIRVLNSTVRFVFERSMKKELLEKVSSASEGYVKKLEFV